MVLMVHHQVFIAGFPSKCFGVHIQLKAMRNIIKYIMHLIFKFLIGPYFSKLKWLNYIYDNSLKKRKEKKLFLLL